MTRRQVAKIWETSKQRGQLRERYQWELVFRKLNDRECTKDTHHARLKGKKCMDLAGHKMNTLNFIPNVVGNYWKVISKGVTWSDLHFKKIPLTRRNRLERGKPRRSAVEKSQNWCFWTVVLEKTLESPLDCKEIKPVHPKGNPSWIFMGRTDAEAETSILWPPDVKNWLTGKDPDAGKDWRQEEKGMTEDEMVGWHQWLHGYEFEQSLGVGDGQGSLACCSPWGHQESDTTEWLNRTESQNLVTDWLCQIRWWIVKGLLLNCEQLGIPFSEIGRKWKNWVGGKNIDFHLWFFFFFLLFLFFFFFIYFY